jgi:hypothetical protein
MDLMSVLFGMNLSFSVGRKLTCLIGKEVLGARGFVIFKSSLRCPDFKTGKVPSGSSLGQGQFGCVFALFHHEAGADIGQFDTRNEALLEIIMGLDVPDARFD